MLYTIVMLMSMFAPKKDACCCECPPNPLCPDSPVCAAKK